MMKRKYAIVFLASVTVGCGAVHDAEEIVKEELIDPTSPLFSDVSKGEGVVCGLVNSKNRLGAYVGKKPFIVADKRVIWESDSDFYEEFDKCSLDSSVAMLSSMTSS